MTHGYWRLSRVHRETFPSPRIYFVSGWPKRNLNISEPPWLSLCSPLQRAADSISAPCRLPDSQAAREANALITACHMIGLARVLSNKALMSSFNCLRSAPLAPPAPSPAWTAQTHAHPHLHTLQQGWGGREGAFVPSEMASKRYRICVHHWRTNRPLSLSFQCIGVKRENGFEDDFNSILASHNADIIEINKCFWLSCGAVAMFKGFEPPWNHSETQGNLFYLIQSYSATVLEIYCDKYL